MDIAPKKNCKNFCFLWNNVKNKVACFFCKKNACFVLDSHTAAIMIDLLEQYKRSIIAISKIIDIYKSPICVDGEMAAFIGEDSETLMKKIDFTNSVIDKINRSTRILLTANYANVLFSQEERELLALAGARLDRKTNINSKNIVF